MGMKEWMASGMSLVIGGWAQAAGPAPAPGKPGGSLYEFSVKDIEGREVKLEQYRGHVVLIVNVASYCGYTPQYIGLQALYEKYRAKGFEVLGFPANEFGKQEPGTNEEIKKFCSSKYRVTFPLFAKVVVKGPEKVPLFRWLTESGKAPDQVTEIGWNFEKFLVGSKGELLGRFKTKVTPDSEPLVRAIEAALAAPNPTLK